MSSVLMNGRFNSCLEIGIGHAYSTSAFIYAREMEAVRDVTLCDLFIRDEAKATLEKAKDCTIQCCRSTELIGYHKFVCVDGGHDLATVKQEVELLLDYDVPCIMAHDTCLREEGNEGPAYLKEVFQAEGYYCLEDSRPRPNERTDRGFFFAAKTLDLFNVGLYGFRLFCR